MLLHQTTFSSACISIDSVVSVHCEPCKHCAASEQAESQYFLDKTRRDKDAIFQSQCPQRKLKWRKQGNTVSHPCSLPSHSECPCTTGWRWQRHPNFSIHCYIWDLRTGSTMPGFTLRAARQWSLPEKRQREPSSFPCLPRRSSWPLVYPQHVAIPTQTTAFSAA